MFIELLLITLSLTIFYGYHWAKQRQTYWKRNNVPYIESLPLLGHFTWMVLLKENIAHVISRLYNHPNAKGQPYVGINVFHKPALLIRDPELIKQMAIKDFNYFVDHLAGADPVHDPVGSNNLFQQNNPLWKKLRAKLSPIFTSGKMKQMFYMVEKVGNDFNETLNKSMKNASVEIECHEYFGRFTADAISLVAFATEANCIKDPERSEFLYNAKNSFSNTPWNKFSLNSVFLLPELASILSIRSFDQNFENFIRRLFNEMMSLRIKNGGTRNDLIDCLIAIQNNSSVEDKQLFTEDVLLAQAAVFYVAGFDTSSSTLSFLFYFLAKNKHCQEKLREEIKSILQKNDGKVTYENITQDMPYLHASIMETLRFYPVLSYLDRVCKPPNGESHYSLEPFSSLKISKGTPVFFPAYALHMDPEYFPNPYQFDPERFINKTNLINEYAYMPFGIGPRICIGERFAMMQMKMATISTLRSFTVELSGASAKGELQLDESSLLLHPKNGVHVVLKKNELF